MWLVCPQEMNFPIFDRFACDWKDKAVLFLAKPWKQNLGTVTEHLVSRAPRLRDLDADVTRLHKQTLLCQSHFL